MALSARKAQPVVRDISERKPGAGVQAGASLPVRGSGRSNSQTATNRDDQIKLLKDMCAALTVAVEILEQPQSVGFDSEFDFNDGVSFYEEVRRFESDLIRRALRQTGGRQTHAAALLGINHTTLHAMMKRYNIKAGSL